MPKNIPIASQGCISQINIEKIIYTGEPIMFKMGIPKAVCVISIPV